MASKIRRVKECRKDLQRWINLANSVPASFEFGPLFDDSALVRQKDPMEPAVLLAHLQKKLPFKKAPRFYRYLKSELTRRTKAGSWFWSAIVGEISDARQWLRMIARRGKATALAHSESGTDISEAFSDFAVWGNPDLDPVVLEEKHYLEPTIDQDGRLGVHLPDFVNATLKVEALRIKECPICGSIFWAGRKEKSACSDVCTNRWHVQQSYARQKANRERRKKFKARKAGKQ